MIYHQIRSKEIKIIIALATIIPTVITPIRTNQIAKNKMEIKTIMIALIF